MIKKSIKTKLNYTYFSLSLFLAFVKGFIFKLRLMKKYLMLSVFIIILVEKVIHFVTFHKAVL